MAGVIKLCVYQALGDAVADAGRRKIRHGCVVEAPTAATPSRARARRGLAVTYDARDADETRDDSTS